MSIALKNNKTRKLLQGFITSCLELAVIITPNPLVCSCPIVYGPKFERCGKNLAEDYGRVPNLMASSFMPSAKNLCLYSRL